MRRILPRRLIPFLLVTVFAAPSAIGQPGSGPARFDSLEAVREIGERNKIFLQMLGRKDSVGLADFYTTDAKIFHSIRPEAASRDAIVNYFGWIIRAGINKCRIETNAVWGTTNDLVVEEGRVEFVRFTGVPQVMGQYLLVWKREDGVLKVLRNSFFPEE